MNRSRVAGRPQGALVARGLNLVMSCIEIVDKYVRICERIFRQFLIFWSLRNLVGVFVKQQGGWVYLQILKHAVVGLGRAPWCLCLLEYELLPLDLEAIRVLTGYVFARPAHYRNIPSYDKALPIMDDTLRPSRM